MRKLLDLLAAGAFLLAYAVPAIAAEPAIAKGSFRIICKADGIIDSVERWTGKGWEPVREKTLPIKGLVSEIKAIHILLGPVDPCIYQLGAAYCW